MVFRRLAPQTSDWSTVLRGVEAVGWDKQTPGSCHKVDRMAANTTLPMSNQCLFSLLLPSVWLLYQSES